MRTRTKICGITNLEDALYAVQSGVDALGFVFYPPSPRYVSAETACEIIAQLPVFVTMVGLFVNEQKDIVREVIKKTKIDLLQFHGDESELFCCQFERPYIKAIRMKAEINLQYSINQYTSARAILLDTYIKGTPGGTGETFNWESIPAHISKPIILAGGLTAENINDAITKVHPYAVDISGGVEKQGHGSKGLKDHTKIKNFIRNVKNT